MSPHRPLSPHLQIYKIQMTSFLSILHRVTGAVLVSALIALVFWILALASGPLCHQRMMHFYETWLGKALLLAWWCCFSYHLSNGIRHLMWDAGYGYALKDVYLSGWVVIGSNFLALLWGGWIILR
jgi:succinate dehydrogenase / fumarate reductase, cytochrome b subunit